MKTSSVLVFLGCSFISCGQNLIENGSFENITDCPLVVSKFVNVMGWYAPTKGTTDLFCTCKKGKTFVGIPLNILGYQKPKEGKCYAGIVAYDNNEKSYREYMQIKLMQTLIKGKKYCFTLNYSFANHSVYYTNKLGLFFSPDKKLAFKTSDKLEVPKPIYFDVSDDTLNWKCVSILYNATGDENYVTIGGFNYDAVNKTRNFSTIPAKFKNLMQYALSYYYLDVISLLEIKDSTGCPCNAKEFFKDTIKTIIVNGQDYHKKIYTLKKINFATNKFDLPKNNIGELDTLIKILKSDPTLKIKIEGHTDNIGKEESNQVLSEKRAVSIKNYLIENGISESKIETTGYGSSMPVTNNDTEANRAINRRVEIIFE